MRKSLFLLVFVVSLVMALILVMPVAAKSAEPVSMATPVMQVGAYQEVDPVELPQALVNAITIFIGGAVTWLVVAGIKGLVEAFGGSMDGIWGKIATALAAVISGGVVLTLVGVINILLSFVPETYASIVSQVLVLLVTVLGSMGIQRQLVQRNKAK